MSTTNKKHELLLRQSPVGCLVLEDCTITELNPEAVDTLGIPNGKLVGVPLKELVLPEFELRCVKMIAEANDLSQSIQVRLARAAAPIEFTARQIGPSTVAVAVRSLVQEAFYSAAAKGDLTHDQTTGLPNRYYVLGELERHLASTSTYPFAIVAIWIDDLIKLSEERSDTVSDRILSEVAQRLEAKLRGPDLLGRFDDSGFVTVLRTDVQVDQLAEIGDRLRDEIAFPVKLENQLVSFTTSLAIGSIQQSRPTANRVLALFEAAANRAETGGGDRTEVIKI